MKAQFAIGVILYVLASFAVFAQNTGVYREGSDYETYTQRLLVTEDLDKVFEFTHREFTYSYRLERRTDGYFIRDCDVRPSSGWDSRWDYYSTIQDPRRRAHHLADICEGMDYYRARDLVDRGYFKERPHSWNHFRSEIERADRELDTYLYGDVIGRYGDQNWRRLGYRADYECGGTFVQRSWWEPVYEKVYTGKVKTSEVRVEVEGTNFYGNEGDQIYIYSDGSSSWVEPSSANLHVYRISEPEENFFHLQATSRRKVKAEWAQVGWEFSQSGGDFTLIFGDSLYEDLFGEGWGETYVEIELLRERWGSDKRVFKRELPLESEEASFNISSFVRRHGSENLKEGRDYYLRLRFRRDRSSKVDRDSKSPTIETHKLEYYE